MIQTKHFPGDYKDDLYVSEIRRARRMGSVRELIQNPTFGFSIPPNSKLDIPDKAVSF